METNVKEIFAKYNIPTDRKEFKVNYTNLINCINEINKEVLKEASKSAKLEYDMVGSDSNPFEWKNVVKKSSITSTINKVKF